MQRQSLGSPSSKLPKDVHHKQYFPSSPSPSTPTPLSPLPYGQKGCNYEAYEEEDLKKKLTVPKPKATLPQTYIHLIPFLTLLCFLILFLSSHHPTQNDLAQFNGFVKASASDSEDGISELIKKGDVLAIRSLKNSDAAAKLRRQSNRKMVRA